MAEKWASKTWRALSLTVLCLLWVVPMTPEATVASNESPETTIKSIDVWQKGSVAELIVKTSRPVTIKTARRGSAVIAVFQQSRSEIALGEHIPDIFPFESLNIRESRNYPGVIGLTVRFSDEMHEEARVESDTQQFRITVPGDYPKQLLHWSAALGKKMAYQPESERAVKSGKSLEKTGDNTSNSNMPEASKSAESSTETGEMAAFEDKKSQGEIAGAHFRDSTPQKPRKIVYEVYGRDPFIPLDQDEISQGGIPDVNNLKLVGVLYDRDERVALFEDMSSDRKPYAMRERDRVDKGRVFRIREDHVIFLLNESGISHTFTLKLHKKPEN
ncbi:MAG: hypothetical protein ACOC4C_02770 [Fibrobacterota bacterium]